MIFAVIFYLFCAAPSALAESEKSGFTLYLFNLETENSTQKLGETFSSNLAKALSGTGSLKISGNGVSRNYYKIDSCKDNSCLEDLKKKYTDGIFIAGAISRKEIKVGEKKISRYFFEEIKEERFYLKLYVFDLYQNRIQFLYEKEYKTGQQFVTSAEAYAKEINDYYTKAFIAANGAEQKAGSKKKHCIYRFRVCRDAVISCPDGSILKYFLLWARHRFFNKSKDDRCKESGDQSEH